MADSFQLAHQKEDDIILLTLAGYLERNGGADLRKFFETHLEAGYRKFIFDFTKLELLNSQGLAALLEVGARVVEESDGSMAAFGCDSQTQAVLEMSSFFYLATEAESLEEARNAVQI